MKHRDLAQRSREVSRDPRFWALSVGGALPFVGAALGTNHSFLNLFVGGLLGSCAFSLMGLFALSDRCDASNVKWGGAAGFLAAGVGAAVLVGLVGR